MAQNTNLNVTPYYDDFDKAKNFYRVLYRPGYPIQARELTTSQSILQNQIENVGAHLFKDGAMVIPGQVGYDLNVDAIMVQENFLGTNIEQYRTQLDGKIIEGLTTGVKAKVLYSISATESEKGYITLYVKYLESGGAQQTQQTFQDNEQLVTDTEITFGTTLIEVGSPFAQLLPTAAIQKGSAAYIQSGVYFIRGFFVDVAQQYILLDQYGSSPSYRVGLEVRESIVTPEDDLSLNDNAAGTSNYAAPGAHRFRITTTLVKKVLSDDADKDFLELLRINASKVEKLVDRSAYQELEKSLATRTYEESGDYTVKAFGITMRENLDDGTNNGVYRMGDTTSSGASAAENLYSVEFSPGVAYVRGYRIKTLGPTYVDLEKPRDTLELENNIIPFEMGNFANVENVYGFPNIAGSTVANAYQVVELYDTFTVTPGNASGNLIGYARALNFEFIDDPDNVEGNNDDTYKLNIFDIQMITVLQLASAETISQGSIVVGASSGARAYVIDSTTSDVDLPVYQVEGKFQAGESLKVDGLDVTTISRLHTYEYSDVRQTVCRDESNSTVEFTADIILEDLLRLEGDSFTYTTASGGIVSVDTFSAADASRAAGTYTVSTFTTDATGTGAEFSIVVDGAGDVTSIKVLKAGSGYVVDETITVGDAQLGGGGGASFTFDVASFSPTIAGLNSNFAIDLRPGDEIYFSPEEFVVVDKVDPTDLSSRNIANIVDYATQTVLVTPGSTAPTANTYTILVRYRSRIRDARNANLLSPMPKKYIKSISDESMTVRRTFDNQTVAANAISITLPENEQFSSISNTAYDITVLAGTNGTYPVGSNIPVESVNAGVAGYMSVNTDRTTLTVSNLTNITSCKITASISKNVTQRKTKASNQMFVLNVNKTTVNSDKQNYGLNYSNIYGTRIQDRDISLGLCDAYRLHAVYESNDDNDPVIPNVTLVEPVFFGVGTTVTGQSSNAKAKVVEFASGNLKLSVVYQDGTFIAGETITGFDQNGTALSAIINDSEGSVVAGSKVVTENYFLEVSQTGFVYNVSRITRKRNVTAPIRKLKVVLDFYTHSTTGDYFGGQSYLNTDYADIPFFGVNFLADYLDFRPGIKNLYSGTGTVSSPAFVNCSTFDFKSRVFSTGSPSATIFDIPKIGEDFRCDFDWYLPRVDKAFLLPNGEFQLVKGKSAEAPQEPDNLDDGMLLATMYHKPYGFDPEADVVIKKSDNKRYTMRDIGAIERRLNQVEYYTSLNMLESNTFNTKIIDGTGKDRLKNGFIVDDFADHGKSETSHEDFNAALDFRAGEMRASHYCTNIALQINTTSSTNYQQTGPVITLPYTETLIINQPYASRVENVNPFNVFTYIGRIDLTPASDDWVDTERVPANIQQIEGNFEQVSSELNVDQNGFAPIEWGSWTTNWTGEQVIGSQTVHNSHWLAEDIGRSPNPGVWGGRGMRRINRVDTIQVTEGQSREGIRTQVVPRIDMESMGDSILSQTAIPWMRSRNIAIEVSRMKPRTRFYSFFDSIPIDNYIVPKVIEVIKDSTLDSRTNATPFVVGETIEISTPGEANITLNSQGQATGLGRPSITKGRFQVAAPNDYYEFNPYTNEAMPTDSYSSTTNFININTKSLAEEAVGDYYGNFAVGDIIVGLTSGARAVVENRRVISDRLGQFGGSFYLPPPRRETNPRWATGSRTLRFTTDQNDSRLAGAVSSSAETTYEARGTLNTVQENILAVRNAEVVRDTVSDDRVVSSVRTETRQIGWYDPLAQSFIVDEEGGVFLTSVDVFFNTKDENIPISMQIRTMENGYPTTTILPFSDVTLNPSQVQLSETGAVATKFTFRAPVYIPQSIEHCFVILSDSNTYQVWISRMGDLDITGDRTISEQPYAGVLFKSQNASTWTADQYEDLKFNIYKATFNNVSPGQLVLNNAGLGVGNGGILNLRRDPIQTFTPQLQIQLDSTSYPFTVGARIRQSTSNAQGTIIAVGTGTSANLLTLEDISGVFQSGTATTFNIQSSKTIGTIGVAAGTWTVGHTITGSSTSATATITEISGSGPYTLTVNFVSDDFTTSDQISDAAGTPVAHQVTSFSVAGDAVVGNSVASPFLSATPTFTTAQRKIKVSHSNHCMHDLSNNVTISGIASEISPTALTAAISATDTSIQVADANAFHTTINGSAVGVSNLGYIQINGEIISYSAISGDGKTITAVDRGVGSTTAAAHADDSIVECYNLDGIPLIEINKTHNAIQNPTLDSYELSTTSIGNLGIISGGIDGYATQNIQYEVIRPTIEKLVLPGSEVTARLNAISGTSVSASSLSGSFANDGIFSDVLLNDDNYLVSPKLVCSSINEEEEIDNAKSLRLDLTLSSNNPNISPVIDTDRLSTILVMNRINQPADDSSSLLSVGDENAAVYITRTAALTNTSGALKVYFTGYRPPSTNIRVLYRVRPAGNTSAIETFGFNYFDTPENLPGTTELRQFRDYEYEVSGLNFDQYQIKIVLQSTNQAYVPVLKDLRAIALAV